MGGFAIVVMETGLLVSKLTWCVLCSNIMLLFSATGYCCKGKGVRKSEEVCGKINLLKFLSKI